jgi:hypothetical protein
MQQPNSSKDICNITEILYFIVLYPASPPTSLYREVAL